MLGCHSNGPRVSKSHRSLWSSYYIPRILSPSLVSVDIVGLVSNGNGVAVAPENGWLQSRCTGDNSIKHVHVNNCWHKHAVLVHTCSYCLLTMVNIIYMYFTNANAWVKVNPLPHVLPQEKLEQLKKVPRHIENAWAKTNTIHSGYLQESVT